MDRIIPYGYPTIPGGASGGASVDPTPPSSDDPDTPTATPYDLSDLKMLSKGLVSVTNEVANVKVGKTASADISILQYVITTGIVPVDLTGVKQIVMTGTDIESDDFVLTADGVSIKDQITNYDLISTTKTIETFLDGDSFVLGNATSKAYKITSTKWNAAAVGKQIVFHYPVHIVVYDVAGEIMQEYDSEVTL